MHVRTRAGAVLEFTPLQLLAVEAKLQAAKRLRRTGLLADKRARVLRAARATYLELECAAQPSAYTGFPARQSQQCRVAVSRAPAFDASYVTSAAQLSITHGSLLAVIVPC